jgi:hypothetical protein
MSKTPLPEHLSPEDLGDEFILVPYALQFADEEYPMPVGCIVYEKEIKELTAYVMGADGEWSQTNNSKVDESSEVFGVTPDSLYQSIIGVAGSDWGKLNIIKEKLSEFVEVESTIDSDLVDLAGEVQTDSYDIEFCSCTKAQEFTDRLMSLDDKFISVSVCKRCGGFLSTTGVKSGKKQFAVESDSGLYNVASIEDDMEASNLVLTDNEDLYMYTQSGSELNSITGLAVVSWWQSQRVNPSIRSFVPRENNITVLCRDDSIVGILIWSYMFDGIVTLKHVGLFDIHKKEIGLFLDTLSDEENSKLYMKKPYSDTEIDSFVTPVQFMSASIQMASKPGNSEG